MHVFSYNLCSRIQVFFGISLGLFLITSCSFKLTPKIRAIDSTAEFRASANPAPTCSSEDLGCDGVCYSGKTYDCAGNCDGDAQVDCRGFCNGTTYYDCKGICGGTTEIDCTGDCGGSLVNDNCGVCGGTDSSCEDCNGVANGGAVVDRCGACDGDGTSCPVAIVTITGLNVIAKNGTPTGLSGEVGDTLQISDANLETSLMMVQFGNIAPVPFSYDTNSRILSGLIPAGLAGITSVTVIGANGANVIARDKLNIGSSDCLNGQFDECDVCDGNGTTCTLTPLDDDISLQLSNIRPSVPWIADSPIFDPDGIPPLNKPDAPFVMPIDPPDDRKAFDQAIYRETGSYDQEIDVSFDDPSKGIPACFFSNHGLKDSYGADYTNSSVTMDTAGASNLTWPIVSGALQVPPPIPGRAGGEIIKILKHPSIDNSTGWSAVENNEYDAAIDYHVDSGMNVYLVLFISHQLDEDHPLAPALSIGTGKTQFQVTGQSGNFSYVDLLFADNWTSLPSEVVDARWQNVDTPGYPNPAPISVPASGQFKIIWKYTDGFLKVRVLINGSPVYMLPIYAFTKSYMEETKSILTSRSWPPYKNWRLTVRGFGYSPTARSPLYIDHFKASARYLGPTPTPAQ